jgi:hypothetical protein
MSSPSTAGRSGPRPATFEGHEHAGWEPATPLTDEDIRKVERIEFGRTKVDFKLKKRFDDLQKELEGDLVPVCACGWRGLPEDWEPPHSRSRSGGQQQISHELNVRMDLSAQRFAAGRAAAALIHAAKAWTGEEDVTQWLRARAEHILNVGLYDGEVWP